MQKSKMKQFRIGNQTSFTSSEPTLPFEYAVENGFDAFEWFPDKKESGAGWDTYEIDDKTRRYIKHTAHANDINLSLHTPWWVNPMKPECHRQLMEDLKFAQDIGATLLNMHLYIDEGIESYIEAILPFINYSSEIGMKLSIENTTSTGPEDFNAMLTLLQSLHDTNTGHVGMCLDLGHANLYDSTRNDYIKFIDHLDLHVPIIHIHLHENYGDNDNHLTIFTGPAGENDSGIRKLLKRLKKRDFSGSIILEQWPEPPALLNEARDRLYHILGYRPDRRLKPAATNRSYHLIGTSKNGGTVPERPQKVRSWQKPHNAHERLSEIVKVEKFDWKEKNSKSKIIREDDFVKTVVEADRSYRSWRERLSWVSSFFANEELNLSMEQLIYLAIYLRFLITREVPCSEDGRHFRPSHHAKMAHRIQESLSRITTSENELIIRKIYPSLPSFDSAFIRTEPLTRIRDIAHRNDIPKELKKEIKQTLQNKLHRCAGPEDLATSSSILERITAPDSDYSPAFVEQFKVFHEELKEFFNASTLDERLEAMIKRDDREETDLIRKFLTAKKTKMDTPKKLVQTLALLTELRSRLIARIKDNRSAGAQQLRLVEIGLEDFAFVLTSRLMNKIESHRKHEIPWDLALNALTLTVKNLYLGSLNPEECSVIESELYAWSPDFDPCDREKLLRLCATLNRCQRLANEYSDRVLNLFPERVKNLGIALGVAEHAINAFCEGDIRGNLVFQFSKLISLLLKKTRELANLSPWDILVTGKVSGRLVSAGHLDDLPESFDKEIIVLLKKADGYEEIPKGVDGIILGHEMPHLSHLSVRARQKRVVFVVCEDEDRFRGLERLSGEQVSFDVHGESVHVEPSSKPSHDGKKGNNHNLICLPEILLTTEKRLLPLSNVTHSNGGGKAFASKRLEELSLTEGSGFKTPPALVIPYGVLEEAINSTPEMKEKLREVINKINTLSSNDLANALTYLQDLIRQLRVHDEIVYGITEKFAPHERLIARSSANCEDLKEIAGAGLYDSIMNVSPSWISDAVKKVWASLWTKRSAISRKQAGIPRDHAHMAVLIQKMLTPDFSFIMHTVNPISHNADEVYLELAVGLGETLASGSMGGTPYRMVCNKHTGKIGMLSFANYSHAIWPDAEGGLFQKRVDYSRVNLSKDLDHRNTLGVRLMKIGRFVEDAFGHPQDIEGAIVGNDIYLVQSRAQQGIDS